MVNNKTNGVGIMLYNNGFYYEGAWQDGLKHGKGRLIN